MSDLTELVEFLWDCIADDEASGTSDRESGKRFDIPASWKRQIIRDHAGLTASGDPCREPAPCRILKEFALVYENRPNYRGEWKP